MIRAFLRDPKSQLGTGLQDLQLGLDNLRVHKLRSLLTMLGDLRRCGRRRDACDLVRPRSSGYGILERSGVRT